MYDEGFVYTKYEADFTHMNARAKEEPAVMENLQITNRQQKHAM